MKNKYAVTSLILFSFLTSFVSTSLWAHSEGVNSKEVLPAATVSVQGVGSIDVVPNAFSVTFVIEAQGKTVSPLSQSLASDLKAIVKFLLKEGIEERYIQSMEVRLTPRYVNTPQGRNQDGFTLSREISPLLKIKKKYRSRLLIRFKEKSLKQKLVSKLLNSLKISNKIKLTVDVDPINFG